MIDVPAIWTPDLQQRNFRAILDAVSYPGRVQSLAVGAEHNGVLAVLATLLDGEVSLADPERLLDASLWPLLQARSECPEQADFILCDGALAPSFEPSLGTLPSPDQSATLVLRLASVRDGSLRLRLSGPGINGTAQCALSGLHPEWLAKREDWNCDFPTGVDLLLVDNQHVLALPRTCKVEVL